MYRLPLCLLLLFAAACSNSGSPTPYASPQQLPPCVAVLQTGDIVLRSGRDELSRFFRNLNEKDRRFSHCGVLLQSSTGPKVLHIVESASDTIPDLQFEAFARFVSAAQNEAFRVVRLPLDSAQIRQLPGIFDSLRKTPIHFDVRFNLETDTALYCTELIYKIMRRLKVPDSFFQFSQSRNGKRYLGVDGLYLKNPNKTICELSYK